MQEIFRQLSAQRIACKLGSVVLAFVILLAAAFARFGAMTLLWAALPVVLLGFIDAGYRAKEGFWSDQARKSKSGTQTDIPLAEPAMAELRRFGMAVCSLSIWPFYLALWGAYAASAVQLPRTLPPQASSSAQTSAGNAANINPSNYPFGVLPRYPNGIPYTGPVPGTSGAMPRTPLPAFPRPGTPPAKLSAPPTATTPPPLPPIPSFPQPVPGAPPPPSKVTPSAHPPPPAAATPTATPGK